MIVLVLNEIGLGLTLPMAKELGFEANGAVSTSKRDRLCLPRSWQLGIFDNASENGAIPTSLSQESFGNNGPSGKLTIDTVYSNLLLSQSILSSNGVLAVYMY